MTSPRPFIVAIDGPAGAGKSTVSRLLAKRLGFQLVDTGAIYRCVALHAQRAGIAFDDDGALAHVISSIDVRFESTGDENRVFLAGADVTSAIRTPEVSMGASQVSRRKVVREGLLGLQRRLALASGAGAVLEGRDIGTVVFPDADAKFFLEANPLVRARRRHEELAQKGVAASLESVLEEQNLRDAQDRERDLAPLVAAEDAVAVDSSALPLPEVVDLMAREIRTRMPAERD